MASQTPASNCQNRGLLRTPGHKEKVLPVPEIAINFAYHILLQKFAENFAGIGKSRTKKKDKTEVSMDDCVNYVQSSPGIKLYNSDNISRHIHIVAAINNGVE